MKNEVVDKLPINIQPPSNCACIDCPHAHWHASEGGNPECKCRLMSVIVWKLSRDENCVTACTGSEMLEIRRRIVKPSATLLKNEPHMVFYNLDISSDAGST